MRKRPEIARTVRTLWRLSVATIASIVGLCLPAQALTLYVAPLGSDASDGLTPTSSGSRGPLATLGAALVRMGQRSGAPGDTETTDRIVLMPGIYMLPGTARIDSSVRGRSDKPLVITAQVTGSVILSGGTALPAFRRDGLTWHTRAESNDFHHLWVGNRRATLARGPTGGGWFEGGSNTSRPAKEKNPLAATHPATIDNTRRLVLSPPAAAFLRDMLERSATPLEGTHFLAMHSWAGSRQVVAAFDSTKGIVSLTPPGRWPFLLFDRDQRFAFENHPALLDEAGEWWADRNGSLTYIPRPDETIADVTAFVPRLQTLLTIEGTPARPLRTVVLRGLRFQHAAAPITPHTDGQAATSVPAAVVADHVRGLEIDQCVFEHLGGHALWLRHGVVDSRVRRSHFHDLGGGGIRIGEAGRAGSPAERTLRVSINNNRIEDGGKSFPSAVGIWVGQSGENRIAHNEISDFDYSGVSVGWSWNFEPTDSVRNTIEFNHLHDIGRGVLSDLGGIYTLGVSNGTLIRNNLIERVTSWRQTGGSTAFGIYLDAGSSGIVAENNVALGSTGGGFHLHWGRDNTVRNNVFAGGTLTQAKRVKSGPQAGLRFEGNVLVGDGASVYQGSWTDGDVLTARNVLYAGKHAFRLANHDLRTLQAMGKEMGSVESDPGLQCDRAGCRIANDVADRIGFRPISLRAVGIQDRGAVIPR